MLVGILFKVSAAPFHVWTPDVYEGAPSPVVALLSTAPKAAAFALLLRVVYEMLPYAALRLGAAAVGCGRALDDRRQPGRAAPAEREAHAGLLLHRPRRLPACRLRRPAPTSGIAAASFYIAAYAAMNVGIFAVVTLVSGYDEKLPLIQDFRGLIYRSPLLGSLLIFFLVSLVGIPFTGGFFGKFYSFSAAVGGGAVWLAIIGLLNSGLAAAYYLHLAFTAAQRPAEPSVNPPRSPQVGIAVAASLLFAVAATLILGIIPGAVLKASQRGAHTLQPLSTEQTAPPVTLTVQPTP